LAANEWAVSHKITRKRKPYHRNKRSLFTLAEMK
jgi:hypothetical protein